MEEEKRVLLKRTGPSKGTKISLIALGALALVFLIIGVVIIITAESDAKAASAPLMFIGGIILIIVLVYAFLYMADKKKEPLDLITYDKSRNVVSVFTKKSGVVEFDPKDFITLSGNYWTGDMLTIGFMSNGTPVKYKIAYCASRNEALAALNELKANAK